MQLANTPGIQALVTKGADKLMVKRGAKEASLEPCHALTGSKDEASVFV